MLEFRHSVQDLFDEASRRVAVAGWEAHEWEAAVGGHVVRGFVPRAVDAQEKAANPEGVIPPVPGTERTVVMIDSDLHEVARSYEAATGNCWNCKGSTKEWTGWSAVEGNRYHPCRRCEGTGKAPVTPSSEKPCSEGDRFIGRDLNEIAALDSKGLREDGLPN